MILPVRKCYYLLKVALLLVVVVAVLTFFEKWRGGKRGANAYGSFADENLESEYEREIQEDEALIIPGLGEGGLAAYLEGEDKRLGEESEKKLAINVHLSDRISYNRTLQDARNEACKRVVYDAELPSASVVIIFHNEPYSVVLRTVWSVLNSALRDQPWYRKANYIDRHGKRMTLGYPGQDPSSPYVYLKEVILVDDNSTLPELRGKLDYYVQTRLPKGMVRIIRLPESVGVARARQAGAGAAGGEVLVFLDAHCELQPDWLRPLLARVAVDPHAVATPIIDVIDASTLAYSHAEPSEHFEVGGFTFSGHFTWIDVSEREKRRRGSDIAPTWSPTMAGGLFAMDRGYFWQLGAYDEQMSGWGGENLEMSFRVWQCGGTVEAVPCSRAGHVFRSFHPYAATRDSHAANTARAAEVWMDRHKELYYLWRPDLRNNPSIGDVTHRRVLREKLRCKSFQWYLDRVYPDKYVPVRDTDAFGRFRNPASNLCLDSLQRSGPAAALGLYPCHPTLQPSQMYGLSGGGQLRDEERCASVQHQREPGPDGRRVLMVNCRPNQKSLRWRFLPTNQLQHESTGLCLSARWGSVGGGEGGEVRAEECGESLHQVWRADLTGEDLMLEEGSDIISHDQLMELRKLKKHRRVSRSLAHTRRRPRATANKFVLRLQRTLANNSEQHVEAHILCPHTRLLANNSLVRDLVRILNKHDIQVVNNGRVFDKSGVISLAEWERSHPPAAPTKLPHGASLTARPASREQPPPAARSRPKSHKKHKRKRSRATTPRAAAPPAEDRTTPQVTSAPKKSKTKQKLKKSKKSRYNFVEADKKSQLFESTKSEADLKSSKKSKHSSDENISEIKSFKKSRQSSAETDTDLKSPKSRYSSDEKEEVKSSKKSRQSESMSDLKSSKISTQSDETEAPKSKKSRHSEETEPIKSKTKIRHSFDESETPKSSKKSHSEEKEAIKSKTKTRHSSDEFNTFKSSNKYKHSEETEPMKSTSKTRHSSNEYEISKSSKKSRQSEETEPFKSKTKTRHSSDETETKPKSYKKSPRQYSDEVKPIESSAEPNSKSKSSKKSKSSLEADTELPPTDSRSNEVWRVGVSRFRVVPRSQTRRPRSEAARGRALDVAAGAADALKATQRSGAPRAPPQARPPELLVQGNITFQLDDSMLSFRADEPEDEELAVYTNSTEVTSPPNSEGDQAGHEAAQRDSGGTLRETEGDTEGTDDDSLSESDSGSE